MENTIVLAGKIKPFLRIYSFILIAFFCLNSCRTKILYDSFSYPQIKTIGYCALQENDDSKAVSPIINQIFLSANAKVFAESDYNGLSIYEKNLSFKEPDISKVRSLCSENDLDAIIIPYLGYQRIFYTSYGQLDGLDSDLHLAMKIYDAQGVHKLTIISRSGGLSGGRLGKELEKTSKNLLKAVFKKLDNENQS